MIIVTGDRDTYQLVEDPYVRVLYNKRGVSDYALYDEAGIEERTGVRPDKYPLLAALRGDPSDNLPGVPGVGEKTAAKLVNQYGDLDTLFAHLDALSPKLRQNLADHAERVRLNAEVIPLVRDVPLDVHVDQLTLGGWDLEEARRVFAELELRSLWPRFTALMDDGAFGEGTDSGPEPAGRRRRHPAVRWAGARASPEWLAAPRGGGARHRRRRPQGDAGAVRRRPSLDRQRGRLRPVDRRPGPLTAGQPDLFVRGRRSTGPRHRIVHLAADDERPSPACSPTAACSRSWPPGSDRVASGWWPTTPRR